MTYTTKSGIEYRFKTIPPTTMLAFQMTVDFSDMAKTTSSFNFIFENTETLIAGVWTTLKEKNRDIYYPVGIENDMVSLTEIATTFLNEVVKPLFKKSSE